MPVIGQRHDRCCSVEAVRGPRGRGGVTRLHVTGEELADPISLVLPAADGAPWDDPTPLLAWIVMSVRPSTALYVGAERDDVRTSLAAAAQLTRARCVSVLPASSPDHPADSSHGSTDADEAWAVVPDRIEVLVLDLASLPADYPAEKWVDRLAPGGCAVVLGDAATAVDDQRLRWAPVADVVVAQPSSAPAPIVDLLRDPGARRIVELLCERAAFRHVLGGPTPPPALRAHLAQLETEAASALSAVRRALDSLRDEVDHAVRERDELRSRLIQEADQRVMELDAERVRVAEELRGDVDRMATALSASEERLVEATERNGRLDRELEAVRRSYSWRLTAPLRRHPATAQRLIALARRLRER